MATSVTLLGLRDQIRQRGEHREVGAAGADGYITNAEMITMINASYADLWDVLVDSDPEWSLQSKEITITSGTSNYDLPNAAADTYDFYNLLGVDVKLSNGDWAEMPKFNFADRNLYNSSTSREFSAYRLVGNQIMLAPTPGWSGYIKVWYNPAPVAYAAAGTVKTSNPPLAADTDYINCGADWEEYIVLDCLVKCSAKEGDIDQVQVFAGQRGECKSRIKKMVSSRDQANPERIHDIYSEYRTRHNYWNP